MLPKSDTKCSGIMYSDMMGFHHLMSVTFIGNFKVNISVIVG